MTTETSYPTRSKGGSHHPAHPPSWNRLQPPVGEDRMTLGVTLSFGLKLLHKEKALDYHFVITVSLESTDFDVEWSFTSYQSYKFTYLNNQILLKGWL